MRFKSIASRIIFSVMPFIVISILLFVFVIYQITSAQIEGQIRERMSESLEVASLDIQNELIRNTDIATATARYAGIWYDGARDSKTLEEFLCASIAANKNTVGGGIWFEPYIVYADQYYFGPYAYIANTSKPILVSSYSDTVDYHNANWYLNGVHAGTQPAWSGAYHDPVADVMMVTVSVPIYSDEGTFLGVTTADMSLTDIRNIAASISVGETGQAFIVGPHGEYITFLDDTRTIADHIQTDSDPALATLGQLALSNTEGVATIEWGGESRRVYYTTIPDVDWILILLIDNSEIGSDTTNLVFVMAIVPLIGLVLAAISIISVARHLRLVAIKVNGFADRAAAGDLSERIEVTEQDEFGIMEDRLNTMMDNMNAMNAHLAEMLEVAQSVNQAKSDFLSRMSHEIRTPMNAIIGMTQIAQASGDRERVDDCLTKIDHASKHLLALINDILDFSKIEAGKLELSNTSFCLRDTIHDVVNVIAVKIEEKNQNFTMFIDDAVPQRIFADPLRYSQIITNLLSNAIKFTHPGGNIHLDVCVRLENETECVIETRVIDSGIGLSLESQKKLFVSFEQADGSISRRYGGTGLGLAISKSLVELMGGRIWFQSKEGEGTMFLFTIHTQKESNGAIDARSNQNLNDGCDFSDYSILLVEDVEINREIVCALLKETHINIICAENGLAACKIFGESPDLFDLILMDVQMPEMDGFEATRAIRAMNPKGAAIPIIAMTANAFREDVNRSLAAGMNFHIAKPIDCDLLIDTLNQYLSKN